MRAVDDRPADRLIMAAINYRIPAQPLFLVDRLWDLALVAELGETRAVEAELWPDAIERPFPDEGVKLLARQVSCCSCRPAVHEKARKIRHPGRV